MRISKIFVGILIATIVMASGIGAVSAYDASTPYECTLQWIVPSDTVFSISFAGSEFSVDFDTNLNSATQSGVQPDGQNNATNTPIITISNDGNVALNFTCNLTEAKPAWATLKVNNETSYTGATSFNTTQVVINSSVAIGQDTDMYIWTDVSSATQGITGRTLRISSASA